MSVLVFTVLGLVAVVPLTQVTAPLPLAAWQFSG